MRTHTLAAGDEISVGPVWLTVVAVEGEDVVFGLCPPDGAEVVCEPPEPAPRSGAGRQLTARPPK